MQRGARLAVGIASVLGAVLNFTGCGSSSKGSSVAGGAAAGTGAGASSGAAITTGSSGGANINVNSGGTSSMGTANFDACVADVSTAMLIPLDMYLMLDVSSSMLDVTATNVTKWDAVKSALETFLQDKASAGLGVGLQYFPLLKPNAPTSCTKDSDCTASGSGNCFTKWCYGAVAVLDPPAIVPCGQDPDCIQGGTDFGPCATVSECAKDQNYICVPGQPGQTPPECRDPTTGNDLGACTPMPPNFCEDAERCDAPSYAAPATPIAALPGAAATLVASIDAKMPFGGTPTAPALTGAIQEASTWAKAHPDHRVVVVLATDGLPTNCTPIDIASVAGLAASGVKLTPSISTFVIGVFGPADVMAGAPDNLNQIAVSGGTKSAFIVDTTKDVSAQFQAALNTIRGSKLACDFEVPQPKSGQTLQYDEVNVQFTTGGNKSTVLYKADAGHCDPTTGGWYYDVDPTGGSAPTMIIACPASCQAFQASTDGSVGIALGCMTQVK